MRGQRRPSGGRSPVIRRVPDIPQEIALKKLLLVLFTLLMSVGSAWAAVNANTASIDELQTITGIGPTIAQRIVDERRKGPYKDLADLEQRVKGVGESSIRKMAAGGLTVGGSSRSQGKSGDAKAAKDTGKGTETAADKASPKSSAKSADRAAVPASDKAAAPASDKAAAPASDKAAAPAPAKAAAPASDKAAVPASDKAAAKGADKSAEKAAAKQ
jgi:competence protein ComEA